MYNHRKSNITVTSIEVNNSYEGETIEQKIRRIVNNKEPLTEGAPLIYTERKDGVSPDHNIRTDRFDVAIEAMNKVAKTKWTKREEKIKTLGEEAKEGMNKEKPAGTEGESKA
jgi:hypothetical protein